MAPVFVGPDLAFGTVPRRILEVQPSGGNTEFHLLVVNLIGNVYYIKKCAQIESGEELKPRLITIKVGAYIISYEVEMRM